MPADYSKALPGNMSNSSHELIGTLETLIHSAEHSVDLAIYDLEHPRIGQALAEAHQHGVHVRIVTDNYNRTDSGEIDSTMWATLNVQALPLLMMMVIFMKLTAQLPIIR